MWSYLFGCCVEVCYWYYQNTNPVKLTWQVSKRLEEVESNDEERILMYKQLENLLEAAIINTDYFEQVSSYFLKTKVNF